MSDDAFTYDIGELLPSERNYVLDRWMRGTEWQRSKIVRAVSNGTTYVARDGAFVLGWLCVVGGEVQHGYVRPAYRLAGIMRALWQAAGEPLRLARPSTRIARKLMKRALGDSDGKAVCRHSISEADPRSE